MRSTHGLYLSLCIVFLICIFSFQTVHAQEKNGSLEVSPAFVDITLEQPNEEKIINITYINHSSQEVQLELFPLDFRQADEFGKIGFIGSDTGAFSYSLSSFLSFESKNIQLDAGEKKIVELKVKNREDLSPGGHYAAVVAKITSSTQASNGTSIAPSVSSLIFLRKTGGEKFNLFLKSIDWPNDSLVTNYQEEVKLLFQNEGNIHLVPYGKVEIHDIWGRKLYKGIINTSSLKVFPSSRRYIPVILKKMGNIYPISLNTLTVDGQDSLQKTHFILRETFIYIDPLFMGVLIVGIIFFVYWKLKRK